MIKEGKELLYLSRSEVMQVGISIDKVINLIEKSYEEKARGDLQNPPKAIIPLSLGCNSYAMPALLQSTDYFGMNWQSRFNPNVDKGLSPASGVIGLYRKPTGIQIAILEDSYIDSLCRGAVAGLCAKYLAKKSDKTVSVIGCGDWSKGYLLGINIAIKGIKTILVYDEQNDRLNSWIDEMQHELPGLDYKKTKLKDAVNQADVLITGDVLPNGLDEPGQIEEGWLKKGCLVISTNQDQQFVKGVINQDVDTIVTDDLNQYKEKKDFFVKDIKKIPIDLVEFTSGKAKRQNEDEIIFCCLIGMSAGNTMVAYDIFQRALKQGIGQPMPL